MLPTTEGCHTDGYNRLHAVTCMMTDAECVEADSVTFVERNRLFSATWCEYDRALRLDKTPHRAYFVGTDGIMAIVCTVCDAPPSP